MQHNAALLPSTCLGWEIATTKRRKESKVDADDNHVWNLTELSTFPVPIDQFFLLGKVSTERQRNMGAQNDVVEDLGNGFSRRLVTRTSGLTKGTIDIYVTAPDGSRLRSRPELRKYLSTFKGIGVDADEAFKKPDGSTHQKSMQSVRPKKKQERSMKLVMEGTDSFKIANYKGKRLSLEESNKLVKGVGIGIARVELIPCDERESQNNSQAGKVATQKKSAKENIEPHDDIIMEFEPMPADTEIGGEEVCGDSFEETGSFEQTLDASIDELVENETVHEEEGFYGFEANDFDALAGGQKEMIRSKVGVKEMEKKSAEEPVNDKPENEEQNAAEEEKKELDKQEEQEMIPEKEKAADKPEKEKKQAPKEQEKDTSKAENKLKGMELSIETNYVKPNKEKKQKTTKRQASKERDGDKVDAEQPKQESAKKKYRRLSTEPADDEFKYNSPLESLDSRYKVDLAKRKIDFSHEVEIKEPSANVFMQKYLGGQRYLAMKGKSLSEAETKKGMESSKKENHLPAMKKKENAKSKHKESSSHHAEERHRYDGHKEHKRHEDHKDHHKDRKVIDGKERKSADEKDRKRIDGKERNSTDEKDKKKIDGKERNSTDDKDRKLKDHKYKDSKHDDLKDKMSQDREKERKHSTDHKDKKAKTSKHEPDEKKSKEKEEKKPKEKEEKKSEEKDVAEKKSSFLDIEVHSPRKSPYGLIYEKLAKEPWKLIISSFLMQRLNAIKGSCMLVKFFEEFPTLEQFEDQALMKFFSGRNLIPCAGRSVQEMIMIADSLKQRVETLEEVPCVGQYTHEVFKVFCAGDWEMIEPQSYDVEAYVEWRKHQDSLI